MAEPFISEIRIMSFGFAPRGWALCNGQLVPIAQNPVLFALLRATFGGDGQNTFALPDLRGNVPIHVGRGHTLGERGGEQAHTLSIAELPAHTHAFRASNAPGTTTSPSGAVLAKAPANAYAAPSSLVGMAASSSLNVGGSQAHLNMQPFLALTFCIALQGVFPSSRE